MTSYHVLDMNTIVYEKHNLFIHIERHVFENSFFGLYNVYQIFSFLRLILDNFRPLTSGAVDSLEAVEAVELEGGVEAMVSTAFFSSSGRSESDWEFWLNRCWAIFLATTDCLVTPEISAKLPVR